MAGIASSASTSTCSRIALWVGMLCCASTATALDPDKRFHHYVKDTWSIEEGLPQISALTIAQDAQGYIWVGTQAGAARFDGVSFTTFNSKNTPQIPGMWVQSLFSDRGGRLWVGTYKGMARLEGHRFHAVPAKSGSEDVVVDVQSIRETNAGRIIVTTVQGVYEENNNQLQLHPVARAGAAHGLLVDDDGAWVGRQGGVEMLDGQGSHWFPLPEEAAIERVTRLARTQGMLWAGTSRGLFFRAGESWQRYAGDPRLDELPIEAMHVDGDGNFWVANDKVLFRIVGGRVMESVTAENSAAHRGVRSIFHDREGNLWIGSQWDGIARFWNGWTRRYSTDEGLHEPVVWSLARDPDGRLWMGTNDGVSVLEGERIRSVVSGNDLPHPNAYTFLAEPGVLWVGTRGGLAVLRNEVLDPPNPEFELLESAQINGIVRDSAGLLWIGTSRGLFHFDGTRLGRHATEEGPAEPRVRLLYPRASGQFLVATQDGLFEKTEGGLRRVGVGQGLPEHMDVTSVHEPASGLLVIGTLGEQLFLSDGKRWREMGTDDGVPVNSPFFITHDSLGYLWVTGIRGAFRIPIADVREWLQGKRKQVRGEMLLNERGDHRGSQKGFCCNGAGNAKGFIENDTLWLPSRGGVVTISSRSIVKNALPPSVVIERVRFNQRWKDVAGQSRIELPLDARDVTFAYTALSFQQPLSVRLRYRLQGYDREWHDLVDASRRDAVYTNLPPGPYVFQVEAANNAGVWQRKRSELSFDIPAHWHETRWVFVLAALTLVALGYGVHRIRLRELKKRERELATLVAERTEDLAGAIRQLEVMSHTDPLTGLRNRRYLGNQLPADLAFYEREARKANHPDQVMMLALVDIDHFKSINDRHGHQAGDVFLQQFARILEAQVRSGDYVVRWGGEEFLLVFRPMPSIEPARIAERIRRAVASHAFAVEGASLFNITCSTGFVQFPLTGDMSKSLAWEQVIGLADRALYHVKHNGRNGWAGLHLRAEVPIASLVEQLERDAASLLVTGEVALMPASA